MPKENRVLWDLLQQDDVRALEDLFEAHWEHLFQVSYKIIRRKEDAEEIVSDFFVHLWSVRHTIGHVQNIPAYMIRAVKNRTLNRLAGSKPAFLELTTELHSITGNYSPMQIVADKEQDELIRLQVKQLPPKMRDVYQLYMFEEMSVNEIAKQTGNSPQTVRNQLNSACKKMKGMVLKHGFVFLLYFLEKYF